MNGPLKFLTARKILPLLDLLAKFKQVLACSCSQIFALLASSQSKFFISALACKKIAVLAKTIRHPYKTRQLSQKDLLEKAFGIWRSRWGFEHPKGARF